MAKVTVLTRVERSTIDRKHFKINIVVDVVVIGLVVEVVVIGLVVEVVDWKYTDIRRWNLSCCF